MFLKEKLAHLFLLKNDIKNNIVIDHYLDSTLYRAIYCCIVYTTGNLYINTSTHFIVATLISVYMHIFFKPSNV